MVSVTDWKRPGVLAGEPEQGGRSKAATFPYDSPVVAADQELFVTRYLPEAAELRVRTGARVKAEDSLASIDPHHVSERIPLATQLDIEPESLSRHLERPVGSNVQKGDVLAKARRGLRSQSVTAPFSGTITGIDTGTGDLLLAPDGAEALRALVHGDVITADSASGVVIQTFGARVAGIAGLGKPGGGPLRLLRQRTEGGWALEEPNLGGAIVIATAPLSAGAIRHLIEKGAIGIVTGSLPVSTLADAFERSIDDVMAVFRRSLVTIGASYPIAVMLTEGFGATAMHSHIAETLQSLDGKPAALLPETHVGAPLRRPELVISDPARLDEDGPGTSAAVRAGTNVRLVDPSWLGRKAVATSEPYEHHSHGSLPVATVDVRTEDEESMSVPLANVEVVG